MGGIEMMMKSLGFDPENIKKQIEQAGEDFKAVVAHFNKRADYTDNELKRINDKLDYLLSCLKQVDVLVHNDAATSPQITQNSNQLPKGVQDAK